MSDVMVHPITPSDEQRLARLEATAWSPSTMNDGDAARLTDELTFVQSIKRGVSDARGRVLKPLRERLNEFRLAYDTVLKPIEDREQAMKYVLLTYRNERRLAQLRAAQEAAEAQGRMAAAEAQHDALLSGMPSADAQALAAQVRTAVTNATSDAIAPAPAPNVTQGIIGTTHVAKTWAYD